METLELIPTAEPAPTESALAQFAPRVSEYARASRADSTLRGYRSDWRDFAEWCGHNGVESLPAQPAAVASYISTLADIGLKAGTIQRRISAIAANHTAGGFSNPAATAMVKLTLAGVRRRIGTHQQGKSAAITSDIAAMLSHVPASLIGTRDRALLLIGFAGALRRSELTGIDLEHIEFAPEGIRLRIPKSKTDQEGAGQTIGIAHGHAMCPVRALQAWLEASGITSGPVFRGINRHGRVRGSRLTDQVVATIVKCYVTAAGLDASKYAGHSLRAGFITQAAINGVQESSIMLTSRHRSGDMVRRYVRDANLFRDNVSSRVGL